MMKYYLIKYKNGLFVYEECENSIERIKTFRLSSDGIFNEYGIRGFIIYFGKRGIILFKSEDLDEIIERTAIPLISENLDEIVERAAIEAL